MAKIDHDAKAVAFAKYSVWVKNTKRPKRCEKQIYDHLRVVVCKNNPFKKHIILEKKKTS